MTTYVMNTVGLDWRFTGDIGYNAQLREP